MNTVASGLPMGTGAAGRFGLTKPWGFHPADRSGALFTRSSHNQEYVQRGSGAINTRCKYAASTALTWV